MLGFSISRFFAFCAPALLGLLLPLSAHADIWDDACNYFLGDCSGPPTVVTTVVVIPPPAAIAPIPVNPDAASAASGSNQRELMLQAATQQSMASVLEMKGGNSAVALVEYTMAQQLARKANTLGNGPLLYPSDPGRAPDPVAGRYESITGSREADLYSYLSGLQPDGAHGLDAAKAAYADLLKQVKNSKYADDISSRMKNVKLSEVTALVRPVPESAASSDITRKVESVSLGGGETKAPAAPTDASAIVATPSEPVPSAGGMARSPASVEKGKRQLEELWLFMSDEQSAHGDLAKDVRGVTLFERVKRRYRVWELRQKPLDPGFGPNGG